MDCKTASASLTAFIDGALPSDESPLVAAHLSSCPSCRSRQSALAAARTAFARLPPESAPADFDARLRRRLAPPRTRRWTWTDLFALTPALAAAAVVGFALFRLGWAPRPADAPNIEDSEPGLDAGRWGYDSSESPCSTPLNCG